MKKYIYLTVAIAVLAVLSAAAVSMRRSYIVADIITDEAMQDNLSMDSTTYKSLSVEQYEAAIADTSVFRLDVRSEQERKDDGFIPGTVCIDVQKEDFLSKACEILPKDRTIAVNCRSGRRSKLAAEMLCHEGYDVIELDGGFSAWKQAGKPVVIE